MRHSLAHALPLFAALALALAAPASAARPADSAATARTSARELLDEVQVRTLRYFWDHGHPVSGMAPERSSTPEVVTTGGTGFGVMALVAGTHRGFLERSGVVDRLRRMTAFLAGADRFHGAWPHWLDGSTGRTVPFSPRDDGGDLVETAFLVQGLLAARGYFDGEGDEARLRAAIDELVAGVEWDWYTQGRDVLYWHWSPHHGFAMDLPVRGWNEALVLYVLAAGAASHAIAPAAYHRGWASGGDFGNGRTYLGHRLPLGPDFGGPLFFAHYSFLGLDPRRLVDRHADYREQVMAQARIQHAYARRDPGGFGYSARCWGLTASDGPEGYGAWSPTHDRGVVAPTAALSSFPYLPKAAWAALFHFLTWDGGRLFGRLGFRDAFSPRTGWVAPDYLAIDQGPIVAMIENHRSGLLWRLVMEAPEVRRGLERLGFTVRDLAGQRP